MFKYSIEITIFIVFVSDCTYSARILGVFPVPSISHQVVFRALTNELAKRGHELVVITPNPEYKNTKPPYNITEIDTSEVYQQLILGFKEMKKSLKISTVISPSYVSPTFFRGLSTFMKETYENPAVKELIEDKSQKFDLIIVEYLFYTPLILSKIYDAPLIWFSSFYGQKNNFEAVGAPATHPMLYPSYYRSKFLNLTVWEKIYEIYIESRVQYTMDKLADFEMEMFSQYFDVTPEPTVTELMDNVDLLFVNANPIFEGNRPYPPNVIPLGGMHMKAVKDLPADLKSYLDSSKEGVIYVSLGTNVRTKNMEPELVKVFVDAFEALPFDILWKFDDDNLPSKPANLRIEKWFPQRDLLPHPNVKAFVTQGGLQSTDEAIDSEVPLIGIPFLGDQFYNVEHYVRLGIGVKLDALSLTADDIIKGVNKVVQDPSYRRNVKKLSKLMKDQPQSAMERAVWWTEYVIRHRGAKHLRAPGANLSWPEYLLADVLLMLAAFTTIALCTLYLIVRDLKSYLDSSKEGVIYVSLGTNVRTKNMEPELVKVFVDAFEALPFDILWKFDDDNLPSKPANLRIEKWFPQRDLLPHPNVKAFVTQGGLQSTDEAIDSEVPLIGIPFLGDQFYNVEHYVRLGIGVKLDALSLTADDIIKGVNKVVQDPSYRRNVKKLSKLMKDQPQSAMERAVWWTEYVIRHRGAKHLRAPGANLSWQEYLLADVLLMLAAFTTIALCTLYLIVRVILNIFKNNKFRKLKKS